MRKMYTTKRLLGTVACAALLAVPALAQDAPAVEVAEEVELFEGDANDKGQTVELTETGEIDLHVKELEITKVLQLLSIQGQKNIIASRGVENAKVSADLYKVSFQEALKSILEPNGFGYVEEGNFIYVMTKEELEKRENANRKLITKILRLDYLRADEAAAFVTPMLSENGAITASGNVEDGIDPSLDDAGADNYAGPPTLVIRDYEDSVEEIVSVLDDLDKQPKQVIIEATVLRATLTENNQFGVDFSLFTDLTGASPLDIVDGLISGGAPTDARAGAIESGGNFSSDSAVKLGFVALLLVYQGVGHRIWATLRTQDAPWSSTTYRLLNEVPTVILIAAVFLVVYKDSVSWLGGVAGILGVAIALTLAVRLYKKVRER